VPLPTASRRDPSGVQCLGCPLACSARRAIFGQRGGLLLVQVGEGWDHSDYADLINACTQVSHWGIRFLGLSFITSTMRTSEAMPTLCKEHVTKSEVAAERLPILHGEQVKTGFVVYDT